jgi:dTDP-4-dehydrorhamnose 3,5-epimerase
MKTDLARPTLRVRDMTLKGARVFFPAVFEDERGFFKETYSASKYRALGIDEEFVQDNLSFSAKNVLRGLHGDRTMSKLVQVVRGEAWDVIVDLREESATYREWEGVLLSESNHAQLYIPAGFLHGFLALTEEVVLSYKQTRCHDTQREFAVRWNDPTLSVAWPLAGGAPRLSEKDAAAPFLPV